MPEEPDEPEHPGDSRGDGTVEAVLRFDVAALGLSPPPDRVHMRFFPVEDGARVMCWSPSLETDDLQAWLATSEWSLEPDGVHAGLRGVLSADLASDVPAPRAILEAEMLVHLLVFPDGTVRWGLETSRDRARRILADLEANGVEVDLQRVEIADRAGEPQRVLTDRQAEVLTAAYEAGYFEVPRSAHLKDLAEELSSSVGALSEVLRRAQAALVEAYLRARPPDGLDADERLRDDEEEG